MRAGLCRGSKGWDRKTSQSLQIIREYTCTEVRAYYPLTVVSGERPNLWIRGSKHSGHDRRACAGALYAVYSVTSGDNEVDLHRLIHVRHNI